MIERKTQSTLLDLATSFPVVTVTGPRQAGKTTLCQMAFPEKRYVSLEDPDERRFALDDPRGYLKEVEDGAILDEIQRAPELLSFLQGLVDRDPSPGRFILTGSANLALRSQVTQSLAGRTGLIELLPLDLDERRALSPVEELWQAIWEGGYPAIHHRGIAADRWLGAYVGTYVERDVRQILEIRQLGAFQTFVELAAGHTATQLNLSKLGGDAGISHNTARSWLSVLEAGYLTQRLPPLHRNLHKRVVKTPKFHFLDSGLVCWLLGVRSPAELKRHPLRGSIFDSWVASEVRKSLVAKGVQPRLHHWRDQHGREVDLIIDGGIDLLAVEIKSGATVHSSFFEDLERFASLAREAIPPLTGGIERILVYGGDRTYERSGTTVVPWLRVPGFDWAGGGV